MTKKDFEFMAGFAISGGGGGAEDTGGPQRQGN